MKEVTEIYTCDRCGELINLEGLKGAPHKIGTFKLIYYDLDDSKELEHVCTACCEHIMALIRSKEIHKSERKTEEGCEAAICSSTDSDSLVTCAVIREEAGKEDVERKKLCPTCNQEIHEATPL
jgi:hypothetical protein